MHKESRKLKTFFYSCIKLLAVLVCIICCSRLDNLWHCFHSYTFRPDAVFFVDDHHQAFSRFGEAEKEDMTRNSTKSIHGTEDRNSIKVLVYPEGFWKYFKGNTRNECGFDFDCVFKGSSNFSDVFSKEYSAVLLQGPRSWVELYTKSIDNGNFHRNPEQIWVLVHLESALNTGHRLPSETKLRYAFNWTMTHTTKSTIFRPYFYTKQHKSEVSFWKVKEQIRLVNKTKDFCWIVSNCFSDWAKRRELGNALIPLLPSKLHIWGSGYKNCLDPTARENSIEYGVFPGHYSGNNYEPIQKRIKDCRFYLAFENSNCSDYVTEKFANAIGAGAIPIVNGWRDSYEQKLPGSYIHVSDFENLKNLSKHLASLLRNEDSLMEYHKWRLKFTMEKLHLQPQCQLCEKLSKLSTKQKQSPKILDSTTIIDSLQNCSNSKV